MRTAMKMASLLIITMSLLCFHVIKGCDINAVTGGSIIVPVKEKLEPTDTVKWIFNKHIIFRESASEVIAGKKSSVTTDGYLKLKDVQKKDEGEYKSEINDDNGISKAVSIKRLCVFDPVRKPKVNMNCRNETVTLTCIFNEKEASHQWYKNGLPLKNEKKTLTEEAKKVQSDSFFCNVSNKVSSDVSDSVKISLIKDCIKHTGFSFPEKLFGISIWIFIGGGGGIVLVLIIIVIFCCVRARRKKHMRLMDEQELRLEWSNPDQKRFQRSLPTPPEQHPPYEQRRRQQQQQADHACHAGKAGHTGPRQSRPKQQRPTGPDLPTNQPQPSPRRAAQVPKPVNNADEEQPPPLPQPRKKRP
ncbi:T-cell surface antigen CD2-like isoform X2 [Melanotaenia boesemani]|uniref:T-cell surface antigen CD2-like isoform X2 n=1 Tax=Melanotaenia boesemani TaxID=1250792 RepID=UPI001C04C3A7|nr:T-cell surface antigen CD2-like isoform X2 [Melanotaenia boesemani]